MGSKLCRHLNRPQINILLGVGTVSSWCFQPVKPMCYGDVEAILERKILEHKHVIRWRHHALGPDNVCR